MDTTGKRKLRQPSLLLTCAGDARRTAQHAPSFHQNQRPPARSRYRRSSLVLLTGSLTVPLPSVCLSHSRSLSRPPARPYPPRRTACPSLRTSSLSSRSRTLGWRSRQRRSTACFFWGVQPSQPVSPRFPYETPNIAMGYGLAWCPCLPDADWCLRPPGVMCVRGQRFGRYISDCAVTVL